MKFSSFLKQVRSAHAVGRAIEMGRTPSKAHLKNLGIEESYSETFKRL